MSASIQNISAFIPQDLLTNEELAATLNVDSKWIIERTGILQRNVLKGKPLSYMAIESSKMLLQNTEISPLDIDIIICCTVTGDYSWPATACIIADGIGAINAWGYDISAACSGFLYGFETAVGFIEGKKYNNILLIAGDKMTSCIDYDDRDTSVLFGDGLCSMLIQRCENGYGIIDSLLKMDGKGAKHLNVKAGGSAYPFNKSSSIGRDHFLYMEGSIVFKMAVNLMVEACMEILKKNQLTVDDIDWFIPHQANQRIINAVGSRINIPESKVLNNVARYGNTTNASIPLCIWENKEKFKKGDLILMVVFGAGFTYGAMLYRWI